LRHHVTHYLGCDAPLQIDRRHVDIESGDCLLLCTDGVSSTLSDEEIAAAVAARQDDLNEAGNALVNLAREQGSRDDATVVLAQWS
jgi:serine/threonine protein phosphatase PrpC